MSSRTPPTPESAAAQDAIATAVHHWVEKAVIGLNLCPFARAPLVHGRLRLQVSSAQTANELLEDLEIELTALRETPADILETTLLVHPYVLTDFDEYNDFLTIAELAVRMHGLEGVIQIASFHPDYCFADAEPDALSNYTNRSPHPILHLLRESSIDAAVAAMPDTDAIYTRNMETLKKLGLAGWHRLLQNPALHQTPKA